MSAGTLLQTPLGSLQRSLCGPFSSFHGDVSRQKRDGGEGEGKTMEEARQREGGEGRGKERWNSALAVGG